MSVQVLPYSPLWPGLFEQEAAILREGLYPWTTGGIHHIGSTAIPGLAAKPILDMMAGVRDVAEARDAVPLLARLGYHHAEHRPHEALWFYKQEGEDYHRRTHQLHLTQIGSNLWRERLTFRDALRADDELRTEYQGLKLDLASGATGLTDYTRGKREFVRRVLLGAGLDLR